MARNAFETLNGYVRDAIEATLETCKPQFLASASKDELLESLSEELPVCIIGFSAAGDELSGSLILCCELDFLEASCPRQRTNKDDLMDWLGELANLTLGRLKTSLLKYGIELQLNPPSVSISPVSMLTNYSERYEGGMFWFELPDGTRLCAQFGADTEDLVLTENKGKASGLQAGGAVLNMNPVKKKKKVAAEAPVQAAKAAVKPMARPAVSGKSSFGVVNLVEQKGEQIVIGFTGGARIEIACGAGAAPRTLKLGDQTVTLNPQKGRGVEVSLDQMTFFLPVAA